MNVQLDHVIVPSGDMNASAKLLAEILGVRWEPSGQGSPGPTSLSTSFSSGDLSEAAEQEYRAQRGSVYINDSLTLDFVNWSWLGPFVKAESDSVPINHYCFRVSDADFDAAVERIKKAGVKFSGTGVGEPDDKINTRLGGKGLYFTGPEGHAWEILTVSYARPKS